MPPEGIWGPGEIRAHYGVSRVTLMKWRQRKDFPAPLDLEQGPVWHATDIQKWHENRKYTKENPRVEWKQPGDPGRLETPAAKRTRAIWDAHLKDL